jgi:penicillin amidase
VDDHWRFQRDTTNLMAKAIVPVMAQALLAHKDTEQMGKILAGWDFRDEPNKAAPTVFQSVYRNFARMVFEDELGSDLADTMLEMGYFWQERLQKMVLEGDSPWFDNTLTKEKKETMNDLFHRAAVDAAKELRERFGDNLVDWKWGKVHRIEFVNPLRREGLGKSLLSAGPFPMGGSRETLYCAWYDYDKPFDVVLSASLRMVADLGDDEKVLAVIPGGVSGRTLDHHLKDQVEPFMNGDKVHWWFSDQAIDEHAKSTLTLKPAGD